MSFFFGILLGFALALIGAGIGARWAYRRYVLLERRTRSAERLAELGTLTAGLAHEIKNPLSTIQLNLQLLQEDLPSASVVGSRVHNRLKTVRQEASRLREILDDFLKYAGNLTLEPEPADLNTVVEEVVDFFTPQATVANVRLRFNRGDAPPLVAEVDVKLLKQALLNLLLNATQAISGQAKEGGGDVIVETRRASDGRMAVVSVTDTGPGIAADAAAKVFEAYYTTKRSGTGLGLPMTRRILEEHGGTITVASEPGRGSRFTLTLPLRQASAMQGERLEGVHA